MLVGQVGRSRVGSVSGVGVVLVFCVVMPLVSFVLRLKRRAGGGGGGGAVEVRRRLQGGAGSVGEVVRWVWWELVRAVADTIRMGGRGLV